MWFGSGVTVAVAVVCSWSGEFGPAAREVHGVQGWAKKERKKGRKEGRKKKKERKKKNMSWNEQGAKEQLQGSKEIHE